MGSTDRGAASPKEAPSTTSLIEAFILLKHTFGQQKATMTISAARATCLVGKDVGVSADGLRVVVRSWPRYSTTY